MELPPVVGDVKAMADGMLHSDVVHAKSSVTSDVGVRHFDDLSITDTESTVVIHK
jgi:hypothetical protein